MPNQNSNMTTLDRIEPSIQEDVSVCWIWHLKKGKNGYGAITVDGVKHSAHHAVYEVLIGKIPKGMHLDHVCHNSDLSCKGGVDCIHRMCVNPYHMEVVTPRENIQRRSQRITQCKHGHKFTTSNTYMTPDGRRQCRVCNELRRSKYELGRAK